ncbi:MAG: protein kinase [Myxococcales bacterium]
MGVCTRDGSPLSLPTEVEAAGEVTLLGDAPTVPEFSVAAVAVAAPAGARSASFSPPSAPKDLPGDTSIPAAAPPDAPSSEIFDSLVGATLAGRYQIIRRIGEGGMGAVYEARHTIIGKRVAVKVLLEKFLTKTDFVARLLQEARLASAIGHEHIVDVTDFGTTDDGRAFVAMEFLEGESLAQLVMREAPLPVERSLRITRQVASALGAAHAKGIVHRDVKPENVYLIRRGDADFVKVVDFGISKAVKQGQGDDAPDYHLTHTGLLLGTPLYMSPEQARGDEDLDHRVDVWAMGVMLYECLTGEVPFRANNYLGIISQVLTHTALPPSKLRPELGIPEAVEAVVMRAMEKDRTRRYALMADVERDLERLLAGDQNVGGGATVVPATAPPPHDAARGRVWVWGAAVAALIVGVAMVLARPEPTIESTPDARVPRTITRGNERQPAAGAPPVRHLTPVGSVAAGGVKEASSGAVPPAQPASVSPSVEGEGSPSPRRRLERAAPRGAANRTAAGERAAHGGNGPGRDGARAPNVDVRKLTGKPEDAVIRGVLPSRSGEGYPDN